MRGDVPWTNIPSRPNRASGRWVQAWRRRCAGVGVLGLVALAAFGPVGGDQVLGATAFVLLSGATALAWVEIGGVRAAARSLGGTAPPSPTEPVPEGDSYPGLVATGLVALVAGAAVQTWYVPGTAIAGGDLAPPNGVAWLGHLFSFWSWSGSDLGHPGGQQVQLPWAALLWVVHSAGGSGDLAQRLWFTLLFIGAALAALWVLHLVGASWGAAALGSLFYIFNPFVLSNVGTNSVFLVALVLIMVFPGIIVSVLSGRWRWSTGSVLTVATVPLIGYSYENPPLVLAVACSAVAALAIGAGVYGRAGRSRAWRSVALALPLLGLCSLYWVVPSLAQVRFDAVSQLSNPSSWTWTESRSTLANAFWLNTSWAWPFKEYTPYASHYGSFPLSFLRYSLPILAFGSLCVRYHRADRARHALVLAASGATGCLAVMFLSTGTRFPGAVIFDRLYDLPYGWLLQGPGRFLMLASAGYVVMASLTIDAWAAWLRRLLVSKWVGPSAWTMRAAEAGGIGIIAALGVLAPGYPLAFGAVVPGPRVGGLPSSHVQVPRYWHQVADYLNAPRTAPGSLLVLPVDSFYQVKYTWGYYGNDGFIPDMIKRNILDPSGQGYSAAGANLLSAVNDVAGALAAHDPTPANQILRALGTPDVLVREDLETAAGVGGGVIADGLRHDPAMHLVYAAGPLEVFRMAGQPGGFGAVHWDVPYATELGGSPDLSALGLLPTGSVIVEHGPVLGVPAVVQSQPITTWQVRAGRLVTRLALPEGMSYRAAGLERGGATTKPVRLRLNRAAGLGPVVVTVQRDRSSTVARLSLPLSRDLLAGGTAQWARQPVGDCDDVGGAEARSHLSASMVSGGSTTQRRVLQLSATEDTACESQQLSWHRGMVLLRLATRYIGGDRPALCLWEVGPDRCAPLGPLGESRHWQTYEQLVQPQRGTRALALFLYAVSPGGGLATVDQYSHICAYTIPPASPRSLAVVAMPLRHSASPMPRLTTLDATYSNLWESPNSTHVRVDGLSNGWLAAQASHVAPQDVQAMLIRGSSELSVVAAGLCLVLALLVLGRQAWSFQGRNRGHGPGKDLRRSLGPTGR